jgi:hypothetical protein
MNNVETLTRILRKYKELNAVNIQGLRRIADIAVTQGNIAVSEVIENMTDMYQPILNELNRILETAIKEDNNDSNS